MTDPSTAEPGTIVAAVDGTALHDATDDDAIREHVSDDGQSMGVTD